MRPETNSSKLANKGMFNDIFQLILHRQQPFSFYLGQAENRTETSHFKIAI